MTTNITALTYTTHGYNIQFLGQTEKEALRKENEEMLTRLCKINKE